MSLVFYREEYKNHLMLNLNTTKLYQYYNI